MLHNSPKGLENDMELKIRWYGLFFVLYKARWAQSRCVGFMECHYKVLRILTETSWKIHGLKTISNINKALH